MRRAAVFLAAVALAGAAAARAEPLRRLGGTVPRALARMAAAGRAPRGLRLEHVQVLLGLRDREALDAVLAAQQDPRSPGFRRWLDPTEIADRFGPRRADYERVRGWLAGQGLEVVHDSPYRLAVTVAGTVAQFETALATRIGLFRRGDRLYHAPAIEPAVPESLATAVRGIMGLDDLPKFHPAVQVTPGRVAMAPRDFALAYDVAPLAAQGITGAGSTIAIVGRSNFGNEDVTSFAGQFLDTPLLPPAHVLAGAADPGILAAPGEETEVLLDTEWAGALAPQAQVNVVIGSRQGDIPESLRAAVERRLGDVISISFGLCELESPVSETDFFDALYAIANGQGQTVLVAAGDGGATDCDRSSRLAVNALAASPHAVAVGGTSLSLAFDAAGNATTYIGETAWDDADGAGGGGESVIFGRPLYQLGIGLAGLAGRLLPDLAVAASPTAPGYVMVQGQTLVVGGTSAGAPALASVLALVNQAEGGGGLGQLLPALYRLAGEQARGLRAPVFRDLTEGSNGFQAGPGFDLATGLGSPLVAALGAAVGAVPRGPCELDIDCMIPAPGGRRRSCFGEWRLDRGGLARSHRGIPRVRQACRDGDPSCDLDGAADGRCTMSVALCLNVFDFRFLTETGAAVCNSGEAGGVTLVAPRTSAGDPVAAAFAASFGDLPTQRQTLCTAPVAVAVPLRPGNRPGRLTLRARVQASGGTVSPRVTLTCIP